MIFRLFSNTMVDESGFVSPNFLMDNKTTKKIILANIEDLGLWQQNYRRGDIEAIKASITRFGFGSVLRVWNKTVMAGNHALKAVLELKQEGWEPKGSITVKGEKWMMPVLDISDLSEEEAKAFAIADNRIQELGENDDDQLSLLLQELQESDLLDVTGYDDSELESLIARLDQESRIAIVNGQESSEWVGMPEFTPTLKPFDIMIHCETEEHRQELGVKIIQNLNVELAVRGDTMVGYFPNKERAKTAGIVIDVAQKEQDEAA